MAAQMPTSMPAFRICLSTCLKNGQNAKDATPNLREKVEDHPALEVLFGTGSVLIWKILQQQQQQQQQQDMPGEQRKGWPPLQQ